MHDGTRSNLKKCAGKRPIGAIQRKAGGELAHPFGETKSGRRSNLVEFLGGLLDRLELRHSPN
jgi:hypothetical protein